MDSMLSLDSLAPAINTAHERCRAAYRTVLADAKSAGELLLQAKSQVPYGQWLNWLEKNCTCSDRTARHYMQIATHWEEIQSTSATVADLGVKGAIEAIADKSAPEVAIRKFTPSITRDFGKNNSHRYSLTTLDHHALPKPDIRVGDRIRVTDPESPEHGQEMEVSEIVQDAIALAKKGNETYPLLVNQVEVLERLTPPSLSAPSGVGFRLDKHSGLPQPEKACPNSPDSKNHQPLSPQPQRVQARANMARFSSESSDENSAKEITVTALQDVLRRILDECEEYLSRQLIDEARELLSNAKPLR